jgi:hypothetical protein
MGNKTMQGEGPARLLAAAALLALAAGAVWGQATIAGCQIFPANNVWNRRIDTLPVHMRSQDYILSGGLGKRLVVDPSMPLNVVGPDQPMVRIAKIEEADESDPGPFPIPENPLIESGGDAHMLILQTGTCRLYEMYAAKRVAGQWTASSTAIFDLGSNRLRPEGWTSTNAAGTPVLPGLLRYAEVQSGEIRHALVMTMPKTQRGWAWPARHFGSKNANPVLPPMGTRFRLKRDVDLSGFSREAQVILLAMKRYGLFLTDNGLPFNVSATPGGWPEPLLIELTQIHSDMFEAVDESDLQLSADSGQAGPLPPSGEARVEYAQTLSLNLSQASLFVIELKGDAKLIAIQGATPGQQVVLQICQDAAGNHKFTWLAGISGAMTVGEAAGKCSTQSFVATTGGLYATGPGGLDQ